MIRIVIALEILNKAHGENFFKCVKKSEVSIKLCSPFVKQNTVDEIYENKKNHTQLSLITNINLMNFYKKSSDISALQTINANKGFVYNFQRLHAKIYIFDDQYSIITSANLTTSGLNKNYEYGIYIDEKEIVTKICDDYNNICMNEDIKLFEKKQINDIYKLLSLLPKQQEPTSPECDDHQENEYDAVISKEMLLNHLNLTGWHKDLVEVLHSIQKKTFTKHDYLEYVPSLRNKHPASKTIENTIRRVLQELRDKGLLKFEGNGVYTKLWN